MRIIHRMLVAPLACVGMMLAVGLASGYALTVVSDALDDLYKEHFERVIAAKSVETDLLSIHAGVYALFASLNGLNEAKIAVRLKTYDQKLDAMVASLEKVAKSEGSSQGDYATVTQGLTKYKKSIDTAIDMATMDANMGRSGMQTADDVFAAVSKGVEGLVRFEVDAAAKGYADAASARRTAYVLCGFLLAASIVVAVGLSVMLARAIAVQLQRSVRIAEGIAGGDLSQHIENHSEDEIGKLMAALRLMQDGLRGMIANTSQTARALEVASAGMTNSANDVTDSVSKQSDALASAAALVEQLTVSVAHTSESANEVTGNAEVTSHTAMEGVRLVEQVTAEVRSIAQTVDASAASIEALRESSSHISGIANVIREIADQTNLLALNAAIEAARAGETGRGFAVVADEVRKLAEKTSSATQDIKTVIEKIGMQSSSAVEEMGAVRTRMDAGVHIMESLRDPLHTLERGAEVALRSMRELSSSALEQSNASRSIAQNVESIARMGEINAGAAQRGQQTAETLQGLSRQLSEGIARFRV